MIIEGTKEANRTRKLLTSEPSTPVINEEPISNGKEVALGFSTGKLGVADWGESKEIWLITSLSRRVSDGNRRTISLKI